MSDGLTAATVMSAAGGQAPSPHRSGMIAVLAELIFSRGTGGMAAPALAELTVATRDEPGCRRYVVARDLNDPDRFHLSELWDDQLALAQHFAAPHMATFSAKARDLGYAAPFLKLIRIAELTELKPAELKTLGAGTRGPQSK